MNGTTQNALLGGDIALQATPLPGGFAGGTYSWSFTGPVQIMTGTTTSSVTVRSSDVGTLTATVTYTKNGLTATGSFTINSILPTVTSFSAYQIADTVTSLEICGGHGWIWYVLACTPSFSPTLTQVNGIELNARVHAPTIISDPAQSGMKYVQAVSAFHKYQKLGVRCVTHRSDESNVASGWQVDTHDPYNFPPSTHYFSEGNDLSLFAVDSPGQALTGDYDYLFADAAYVDDRFETYLVYFTGPDSQHPLMQRPMAKVPWNWGGLVVFDSDGHHIRYSNSTPGIRPSQNTNSMVVLHGTATGGDPEVPCPGGPPLTDNKIDSSRFFVRQHYLDFLGREPDASGWDHWTADISHCVFDQSCIRAYRINTGLAFMFADEFINSTGDPVMRNKPGTPGFDPNVYNGRFVYWCYMKYLRRDPFQTNDYAGWQHWTNDLNSSGDYGHIIDAFQVCDEYRNRQGFH